MRRKRQVGQACVGLGDEGNASVRTENASAGSACMYAKLSQGAGKQSYSVVFWCFSGVF